MQEVLERLQEADQLRIQGKLDKAESICGLLVRKYPYYLAGLYTLGLIYLDKKNPERALDCLVRALMCDATNWRTLTALGLVYTRLGAHDLAKDCLCKAAELQPADASILASLGELLREQREEDEAIEVYRRALAADPGLETAKIGLSVCLLNRGRFAEAARILSAAVRSSQPGLNLLHLLSGLPRQLAEVDVVAALDRIKAQVDKMGADSRNTWMFAYAGALDGAGRKAEAWQYLLEANRELAATHRQALLGEIAQREAALKRNSGAGAKYLETLQPGLPISLFILGPSRSGKTSLENLLCSVDGVKAGGEIPIVEDALRRTSQMAGLPAVKDLRELPPSMLSEFRAQYANKLRRHAGSARVFTITVGDRIRDIPIVAGAIPNVRIALIRRDENDNALRIFMTKYLRANAYAYSRQSIEAYLQWYAKMQDLAAELLQPIVHSIRYEELVADPAGAVRTVLGLCGIPDTPAESLTVHDDRGCSQGYLDLTSRA